MEQLIAACQGKTVDEIEEALYGSRFAESGQDLRAIAEHLSLLAS